MPPWKPLVELAASHQPPSLLRSASARPKTQFHEAQVQRLEPDLTLTQIDQKWLQGVVWRVCKWLLTCLQDYEGRNPTLPALDLSLWCWVTDCASSVPSMQLLLCHDLKACTPQENRHELDEPCKQRCSVEPCKQRCNVVLMQQTGVPDCMSAWTCETQPADQVWGVNITPEVYDGISSNTQAMQIACMRRQILPGIPSIHHPVPCYTP